MIVRIKSCRSKTEKRHCVCAKEMKRGDVNDAELRWFLEKKVYKNGKSMKLQVGFQ
jgi:hypothetical protein